MGTDGIHMSHAETLLSDDDGWHQARCTCGWAQGPLPDLETVVDVLMQHAREMALLEDREEADGE